MGDFDCQSVADGHAERLKRKWSFSGLATMVRITLMYYVDFYSLFNNPEKDWEILLQKASGAPPEPSLFE